MNSFEQMMAELRTEYLASFPQKFIDIETHLAARDFSRLREDFHKLKGTGKTYGIPEISTLCAIVENLCLNAVEETASASTTHATSVSLAAKAVQTALTILRKIVTSRQSGSELNLAGVQEFAELSQLGK